MNEETHTPVRVVVFLPDGYAAVAADIDAFLNLGVLWWFEAFGVEHSIAFTQMSYDGLYRNFFRDENLVATVTGLDQAVELEDAESIWAQWQKFLKTDEGQAAAAAIAEMKRAAREER